MAGRKRLVALSDISNIIFKKAKNNPSLGVPKKEVSNTTIEKLKSGADINN